MRVFRTFLPAVALLVLLVRAEAQAPEAGKTAPPFSLRTGDEKKLGSDLLEDRIVVLFYEPKDKVELNREAKDRLGELYRNLEARQKERVFRLPVVDCSDARWPFKKIWQQELIKHSRAEGQDIWGDWDGSLRKDFGLRENEAYLMIMDRQGEIPFIRAGKLSEVDLEEAVRLLTDLVARS